MIAIGCHLSTTDGCAAMGRKMLELGGTTFAFFTRNPRGGKSKPVEAGDAEALQSLLRENHFGKLVAHGSYTMNLCSAKKTTRENGWEMLAKDLERMAYFPDNYYNFHPGAHTGLGTEKGIALIAGALNASLKEDMPVIVLLETMAGKGTEIGGRFEELRSIIDQTEHPEKIGICFDTCHVWDAGYDIAGDLDGVLTKFDKVIGLDRLKAVHFNDSKNGSGSHKDRHEKLGQRQIGLEAMKRIALHDALQGKPFILETPNDDEGYKNEIALVKSWFE